MAHALAESAGTTSLDDLYGGWFELATTARGAPGFRKISYATRFWMRRDGQLYGGPIVFGFYRGLTLYLLRLEPRQKTGKGRPGYDHHLQTVPDFLGREEEQLLSEAPIRPEVISHIVVEPGSPIQMQWIEGGDPSLHEMVLEVSAEGFRVEYSESLKKRLDALQPSERDVKLYYQFTGDPGAPR